MNYKGKKVAVTGTKGFLGSAIAAALEAAGAEVWALTGDIRLAETFEIVNYTFDYLFHFGAPSSQVIFSRQPFYGAETTLIGFMNAFKVCQKNGVKLIYPSTGLLSSDRSNAYARCKALCEDMAKGTDALGLRIFATYGPGEGHKRDYASVPYLIARDIVAGRRPILFGDGLQVRDFIYIDDLVEAVLVLAEECNDPVIDVGTGEQISFIDIVYEVNRVTSRGDRLDPEYVGSPNGYVKETTANAEALHKFYVPKVSFAEGIATVVKTLEKEAKS